MKRCFLICPLDKPGSPIRDEADAMLQIVKDAIEQPLGFEVIRIDQVPGSKPISREIITLIQTCELCVIILTGKNPNVYYEAGRRHETGRPFIHMIREGEDLPFDLKDNRAIVYNDIQSYQGARRLREEIRKFVELYEHEGYGGDGSKVTLEMIADALNRIEAKVGITAPSANLPTVGGMQELFQDPRRGFQEALRAGDIARATAWLPRLEQVLTDNQELLAAGAILSQAGIEPGVELLYRVLTRPDFKLPIRGAENLLPQVIAAMVGYYLLRDKEREGLDRMRPIFDLALAQELTAVERAFILNQRQRLLYGAGKYEDALKGIEDVLKLTPDDPSYVYNAALVAQKLGNVGKALELVQRIEQLGTESTDHLALMVRIYALANRRADAERTIAKLRAIDRNLAATVVAERDIAAALKQESAGRSER